MAWHETARAKAAKIRREWYCDVCEEKWVTVTEPDDPSIPVCPTCADVGEQVFRPFGIKTNASRAVEHTQAMVEREYGVTNFHDHLKPGDVAAMAPPQIQTAEAEAMTRAILNAGGVPEPDKIGPELQRQVKGFFGAGDVAGPSQIAQAVPTDIETARSIAAPAAMDARLKGNDPVALLHEAGKRGLDPTAKKNLTIVSKPGAG